MKTKITKLLGLLTLSAFIFGACSNRDQEKRIAELEAKLDKYEKQQPKTAQGTSAMPQVIQPAEVQPAQPEVKPDGPLPEFQFSTTKHDFGTIKEGDPVEYTYKFKNTGAIPLIISDVRPSCGCTIPEYSHDAIAVGGDGFVKVKFDSNGKSDLVNKTVTVIANTYPKETILTFTAMIVPKKK